MGLFVASEANSRVEKELVTDGVAQCVILTCHKNRALVSLTTVLLVLDLSREVIKC